MRTLFICLFALFIGALPDMTQTQAQAQLAKGEWYFDFNLPDGKIEQQEGLVYYPVTQLHRRVKTTPPRRWSQQWGYVGAAAPSCRIQAMLHWHAVLLFFGDFTAWTVDGALRFLHRYVLF